MKQRYTKLIAVAAAVAMTAGVLSGCGSQDDKKTASDTVTKQNTVSVTVKDTTENNTVDAPTGGNTEKGIPAVEGERAESYDRTLKSEAVMDAAGGVFVDFGGEEYKGHTDNAFTLVSEQPLSTFSTDVDTASYANTRRFLNEGMKPYPDAVRSEEFINYFNYGYAAPAGDDPISITTQLSDGSFIDGSKTKLLLVGLKAKDIEVKDRPAMNIVLLIDVSGSMKSSLKLPLAVKAFKLLSQSLNQNDRVSIVTYSGEEKTVLEGALGSETGKIAAALDSLVAHGATAGEAGINMAYSLAEKYFIEGGNNRIVMATDGDLNVGVSSEEELKELVERKRESGVFLSVLGFGTGNFKDARLEALADNGNGNYSYIDSEQEAEKVLSAELSGTLFTVAKDVKAQIEFDPKAVAAYRLIGYENRALNDEDFVDDTKDAGDMGAGHEVTIIYEIVPANGVLGSDGICGTPISCTPGEAPAEQPENLASVKIRYKQPDGDVSKELSKTVKVSEHTEDVPEELAFAYCAATFAKLLRSEGNSSMMLHLAEVLRQRDLLTDSYRQEFAELIKTAAALYMGGSGNENG